MVKERMGIKELGQVVAQEIEKRIPEAKVDVREVIKNNSLVLHGMTIMDTSKETNIAPTIYLDNFFQEYLNGEMTVEEIAERVIGMNKVNQPEFPFHIELVTKFENVRNKLRIKLVNTKKNEEMLKGVPHKEILDLSAVYQIAVFVDDDSTGTITIHNALFKEYGVTVDELHEAALENMKTMDPVNISGMSDVLTELIGNPELEGMMPDIDEVDMGMEMLVITNESRINGASTIVHKDTLQRLADIFKHDYLILPSSIHECLAIKAMEDADMEGLRAMVTDINANQVASDEVLSDNVYRYSIATGELSIA